METVLPEDGKWLRFSPYDEAANYLRGIESGLSRILHSISSRRASRLENCLSINSAPKPWELWQGFQKAYEEIEDIATSNPCDGHYRVARVWLGELEQAVELGLDQKTSTRHFLRFCERIARVLLGLVRILLGKKDAGTAPHAGLSTFNATHFLAQLWDGTRAKIRRLRREHNKLIGLLSSSVFSCIERK